jgi:formate dehydrogenase subunit gamma
MKWLRVWLVLLLLGLGLPGQAAPDAPDQAQTQNAIAVDQSAQSKAEAGIVGYTQMRNRDAGVFQQNEGQWWRTVRNGPVTFYGGWLLLVLPLLMAVFYFIAGPLKTQHAPTGRNLLRFTAWERTIHWTVAISFVILGLTGLCILFGKHVLIPLMGHHAFSWLATASKNVHNLLGPLFFVSLALMFFTYLKQNWPDKADWLWVRNAGKVLTGKMHVPSGKYNAAEKAWFWGGVALLGIIVSLSGFVLDFPVFGQSRQVMQIANLVHGIGALLFVAASFGHIYMGTVGAEGAFQAMKTGKVDESWAREHHELWHEEISKQAKK